MDQAASQNQVFLPNIRERSEDENLDCYFDLHPHCDSKKAVEHQLELIRNITDVEFDHVLKNTFGSAAYSIIDR